MFLFVCLFVCLFWWKLLTYSSFYLSGKRTGNKRILESTSKENFKVCYHHKIPLNEVQTQREVVTILLVEFNPTRSEQRVFVIESYGPKCKDC